MADQDRDDWSNRDKPNKPQSKQKKGGPSDLIRVMFPISNLASLRSGGKVRPKKSARKKNRR